MKEGRVWGAVSACSACQPRGCPPCPLRSRSNNMNPYDPRCRLQGKHACDNIVCGPAVALHCCLTLQRQPLPLAAPPLFVNTPPVHTHTHTRTPTAPMCTITYTHSPPTHPHTVCCMRMLRTDTACKPAPSNACAICLYHLPACVLLFVPSPPAPPRSAIATEPAAGAPSALVRRTCVPPAQSTQRTAPTNLKLVVTTANPHQGASA